MALLASYTSTFLMLTPICQEIAQFFLGLSLTHYSVSSLPGVHCVVNLAPESGDTALSEMNLPTYSLRSHDKDK